MPVVHPIPPFVRPDSRVLILGSFPSVASRETGFYYGHRKNRFWPLLSMLLRTGTPDTTARKQEFLALHRIALWDVVLSCEVDGSLDSSIRALKVNPVNELLPTAVRAVFLNGQVAGKLFLQNIVLKPERPYFILPSTSAANAAWSMNRLSEEWKTVLDYLH